MLTVVDARTGAEVQVPNEAAYEALVSAGLPPVVEALDLCLPPPRAATLMERVNYVLGDVARQAKDEQAATGRVTRETAEVLARISSFNQTALRAVLIGQLDPRTRGFVPDPYGSACGVDGCGSY